MVLLFLDIVLHFSDMVLLFLDIVLHFSNIVLLFLDIILHFSDIILCSKLIEFVGFTAKMLDWCDGMAGFYPIPQPFPKWGRE
jgi:hypothetical protein